MHIKNTYSFRELRDKLGLSQYDISKKSDIPQPRISEFEQGGKNFTLNIITQMAVAIGYPAIVVPTEDQKELQVRFLVVNPQDFNDEIEKV